MPVLIRYLSVALLAVLLRLVRCQDGVVTVTGLTTGISKTTGERPVRQNINSLYMNGGPQWDLYILGLSSLQNMNEIDQMSYYQIMGKCFPFDKPQVLAAHANGPQGIHGRPYIAWNGVQSAVGGSGGGYCRHNEQQFALWHRPYVALYEQAVAAHVTEIAAQYVGAVAPGYLAAAQSFRIPFWDWATDADLPLAVTLPEMTVNGPNGPVTLANPLYSYSWHPFPLNHAENYFPTDTSPDCWNYTETKRQPNEQGLSQPSVVNANLKDDINPLRDQVYRVFTSATDFATMSTDGTPGPSFESPHNDVHNAMGAIMQNLDYSAFDPIFMLHHCNVDRLLALWQAINYNSTYQTGWYQTSGTFAVAGGTVVTAESALDPFYQADGTTLHTQATVASIKALGYTYPGLDDWALSPDELKESVTAQVNQLYGGDSVASAKTKRKKREHARDVVNDDREGTANNNTTPPCWKEYFAQVAVERSELALPAAINLYVGSQPAGRMTLLNMPATGRTHAEVQLTRALKALGVALDPETAIPLLEASFRVEIVQGDGTLIPLDRVPSLSVQVQDQDVASAASSGEFPVHGRPTTWPSINITSVVGNGTQVNGSAWGR